MSKPRPLGCCTPKSNPDLFKKSNVPSAPASASYNGSALFTPANSQKSPNTPTSNDTPQSNTPTSNGTPKTHRKKNRPLGDNVDGNQEVKVSKKTEDLIKEALKIGKTINISA